ncbi:MAG: Zn-dependent membrane protease YugP [Saprospiraceae bacterium]|jgi:Zn-dependent membrane protease YugP
MMGYYLIIGLTTLGGWLISSRLKGKFKKYSKIRISSGASGAEIARQMLQHYNIHDVKVVEGRGFLSDHYNPLKKTIALSPDVYQGRSIASAAVAAHECGHAVQHAEAYQMLKVRSALVPAVQASSRLQQFLFIGFIFGSSMAGALGNIFLLLLVVTFGMAALFSFITLPVEFDASRRALVWLDDTGTTQGAEYDGAKDALWWAAMTYVASALSALVMFLYFALQLMGRD